MELSGTSIKGTQKAQAADRQKIMLGLCGLSAQGSSGLCLASRDLLKRLLWFSC